MSTTVDTAWPEPLKGIRVIDFSLLLPGPHCTHMLAEMGATVVKVEPPGGDLLREFNPPLFAYLNRGKESVCADARQEGPRQMLLNLVADADVVVEGFRPGVMASLGLGFDAVAKRNPHVIYASISGYGQDGPYANRPGHDVNVIAAAGYFASTLDMDDATMQRPRLRIADYFAAMSTAFTIATLLRTSRELRTARHIDASLFDALASVTLPGILAATPESAADPVQRSDVLADVGIYRTADGRALSIAAVEDKFWPPLVAALKHRFPQIANPQWMERSGRTRDKYELAKTLKEIFGSLSLRECGELLPSGSVCWAPVLRGTELLDDPQVIARGLYAQTKSGLQPTSSIAIGGVRAPAHHNAPELGPNNV